MPEEALIQTAPPVTQFSDAPPPAPPAESEDVGFNLDRLEEIASKNSPQGDSNESPYGNTPAVKQAQKAREAQAAKPAAKEPPKTPEKPAEASKPEAKAEPAKPEEKESEAEPKTGAEPKKLTGWQYGREKEKEAKAIQAKYEALEKELQTLKSRPATPANDVEKEGMKKRLDEYEREIQIKNFEKSDKFKKEYYEPWVKAHNSAVHEAMELVVERDADGEAIEPRSVTEQEAYAIVTAPTKEDAIRISRKIFPSDADADKRQALVATRKDAYEALKKVWSAKEEYQQKGAEFEKQERLKSEQEKVRTEQESAQKQAEQREKWQQYNEAALTNPKLKEYFVPDENDPKAKEIMTKGTKLADLAFGIGERDEAGNLLGADGKPMDEESILMLHSTVRNKAAGFNHLAYKYNKIAEELSEARKALAQYQGSEPGKGQATAEEKRTDDEGGDIGSRFEARFGR